MLQRGRGAGYLAAMKEPADAVWPLLIECITNDPRLDQQCEDRAEYYASLILATSMHLAPLHAHLRRSDSEEIDLLMRPSLPLETIMCVAERGSDDAVQILRDYVSFGKDWAEVVRFLHDLGGPAALDDIDEVLYQRIIGDPGEKTRFRATAEEHWRLYCGFDVGQRAESTLMLPICEPWKTLWERNEKFAGLFQNVGIAYDQAPPPRQKPTDADLAALSVEEMFASVDESNWGPFWRVLPERVSMEDEEFLLQNFASDNRYRAILALRGLVKLGTPRAFEAVKTYIEGSENADRKVRAKAFDAIAEMPGSLTLDTGRQWFRCKQWYLHVPGGMILENHATLEDVPLLVEALRAPETLRYEDFRLGNTLDALARFDEIGPIAELEQVFCQAPDCFDRYRAAKAMSVTAPAQFRDQYALECLWDCHWDTRKLGCKTVSPSAPGALDRLREIEADACESNEVREAARERLRGL